MKEFIGWQTSKIRAVILILAITAALLAAYWITFHQDRGKLSQKELVYKQVDWGSFDFGGHKYPVLYDRESIAINEDVPSLDFFLPVFSPERAVVNPEKPRIAVVDNRTLLYFDLPGEYYLDINHDKKLKVLVLDRDEEISANVLRVFDFLVANLVETQGNDKDFYENSGSFAIDFFTSKEPKMLLCGPTLSFFGNHSERPFQPSS